MGSEGAAVEGGVVALSAPGVDWVCAALKDTLSTNAQAVVGISFITVLSWILIACSVAVPGRTLGTPPGCARNTAHRSATARISADRSKDSSRSSSPCGSSDRTAPRIDSGTWRRIARRWRIVARRRRVTLRVDGRDTRADTYQRRDQEAKQKISRSGSGRPHFMLP